MADSDSTPDYLFYDGHCGLCHRSVQFALRHDKPGTRFRFSPLQGETFPTLVDSQRRAAIPDSIAILTPDGTVLTRSDAVIRVLSRIGGGWRTLGKLLQIIPRPIRDAGYSFVASVRYRIFGRREDLCPVMSPDERKRFDP